jgi:uncharacterized membrane protein YgcG
MDRHLLPNIHTLLNRSRLKKHFAFLILVILTHLLLWSFASTATYAAETTLVWEPSPSSKVAGYVVFYREEWQSGYAWQEDCGNSTNCRVDDLVSGVDYCFAVAAYDDSGYIEGYDPADARSPFSNEVCSNAEATSGSSSSGKGGSGGGGGGGGGCVANPSAKPGFGWPALFAALLLGRCVLLTAEKMKIRSNGKRSHGLRPCAKSRPHQSPLRIGK